MLISTGHFHAIRSLKSGIENRSHPRRTLESPRAVLILLGLLAIVPLALAANPRRDVPAQANMARNSGGVYLEVNVDRHVQLSALRPGDVLQGTLAHHVYSGDRKIFSAGDSIRMIVSGLRRVRTARRGYWPWVVSALIPSHTSYPTFRTAYVSSAHRAETPLRVSLLSAGHLVQIYLHLKPEEKSRTREWKRADPNVTLILHAELQPAALFATAAVPSHPAVAMQQRQIPAGTQARVILLRSVSASGNHAGDTFSARLLEPVRQNSKIVLPEGTLFQGKVEMQRPPRWLSRPGSLRMAFTELTLPSGSTSSVVVSLAGAELKQKARVRLGPEGELTGGREGTAWTLINFGTAAGIAKLTDDSLQLILEAVIASATDASTAGLARIVAGCATGLFLVTRRGRDVILPQYTEMTIIFERPVTLTEQGRESASLLTGSVLE